MKKTQKKKWGRPRLIVLTRKTPAECGPLACKTGVGGALNPGGGDIQCRVTVGAGCPGAQCDILAAS